MIDLKLLIIFVSSSFCRYEASTSQFTTEASAGFFYFLLWLYSLAALVSLVYLDFSLPLNPRKSGPTPGQRTYQCDFLSLNLPCAYCLCSLLQGWKLPSLYIFWTSTHHLITFNLVNHARKTRGISTVFCLPWDIHEPCFWNPTTYTACVKGQISNKMWFIYFCHTTAVISKYNKWLE